MPCAQKVSVDIPKSGETQIEAQRKRRACYALSEGMLDHVKEAQLRYKIPFDDPTGDMSTVVDRVKNGEYTLLDVYEDGEKVGWTTYSIDKNEKGAEFIIHGTFIKTKSHESSAVRIAEIMEGVAKKKGCKSLRIHTLRPGLVKKMIEKENPWFLAEYILKKEIK